MAQSKIYQFNKQAEALDKLMAEMKQTPLGQEILKEMKPEKVYVNLITADGKKIKCVQDLTTH